MSPDPPPKLSDHEAAALAYARKRAGDLPESRMERFKNWRLEGAGFSPFLIYGAAAGVFGFWLLGACVLSLLGPVFALLLTAGVMGAVYYYSHRQLVREARTGAGLCPMCGYDLRASSERCPECDHPVPEEILRRRRAAARARTTFPQRIASSHPPIPLEDQSQP